MSVKLRQFQRLQTLAKDELILAEQGLAMAVSELNKAKAMEQQLVEFRKTQPALSGVVSALQMRQNQDFLGKIDHAINQQVDVYKGLQERIEQAQQLMATKQSRHKAMDILVGNELEKQQYKQRKNDLREANDRIAMRAIILKNQ